jgi:hypothetical protein
MLRARGMACSAVQGGHLISLSRSFGAACRPDAMGVAESIISAAAPGREAVLQAAQA